MLEPVIEHVDRRAELPLGQATGEIPIRSDQDRNARQYARDSTAGRSPTSMSSRATSATIGVFPLPPTRRLPTLMTGRESRRRRAGSRAYHCRRQAAAVPYRELAIFSINSVNGKSCEPMPSGASREGTGG